MKTTAGMSFLLLKGIFESAFPGFTQQLEPFFPNWMLPDYQPYIELLCATLALRFKSMVPHLHHAKQKFFGST